MAPVNSFDRSYKGFDNGDEYVTIRTRTGSEHGCPFGSPTLILPLRGVGKLFFFRRIRNPFQDQDDLKNEHKEEKMVETEKFDAAISQGKTEEVKKLTQGALDAGEKAESILKDGLLPAMEQVGVKLKTTRFIFPRSLLLPEPCMPAWLS